MTAGEVMTRTVDLWIANDPGLYADADAAADDLGPDTSPDTLGDALRDLVETRAPDADCPLWAELLTDVLDAVDWQTIAVDIINGRRDG